MDMLPKRTAEAMLAVQNPPLWQRQTPRASPCQRGNRLRDTSLLAEEGPEEVARKRCVFVLSEHIWNLFIETAFRNGELLPQSSPPDWDSGILHYRRSSRQTHASGSNNRI